MSGLTDSRPPLENSREHDSGQLTPRRFLTEWLLLTALMATPYVVFGANTGLLVGAGVAVAYLSWPLSAQQVRPEASNTPLRPGGNTDSLSFVGTLASLGLLSGVMAAWIYFAYDLSAPVAVNRFFSEFALISAALSLVLILVAAAQYLGPFIVLRRKGLISGSLLGYVRTDLASPPRTLSFVQGAGLSTAFAGLMMMGSGAAALVRLAGTLLEDDAPSIIDAVALVPTLSVGLLSITALLVLSKDRNQRASRVRTRPDGGFQLPPSQGVVATGVFLVLLFSMVNFLNFGAVAALSSVAGIRHQVAIALAIPDWIAGQRDIGLTTTEIAGKLTKHGHWRRGAPDVGLAVLMPALGAKLEERGGPCSTTISAAPVDPATIAGEDWMPAKTADSDIRYCMRTACPSPVNWDAPPSALLLSSHPSRNRYWMKELYIDIHADGVAATPGGYCNTDGTLATDFQG